MKFVAAIIFSLICLSFAHGQNEQAPILEKDITYKNWKYKDIQSGQDLSLRDYIRGKKLVVVIYFAPWCHNWQHDAPMVQRIYEKYKEKGLGIVGVGEYDVENVMKTNVETMKVTFPVVRESQSRDDKEKTLHYEYRKSTGDTRNWGSPYYVFLMPEALEKKGDVLTKHTFVINGEMIEAEGEKFIREKLGLPAMDAKTAVAEKDKVEPCDPEKPSNIGLKKP